MRIGDIVKNNKDNKDYQLISSSEKDISGGITGLAIYRRVDAIEEEEKQKEEKEEKKEKSYEEKQNERLKHLNKMNNFKIKIKKEDK